VKVLHGKVLGEDAEDVEGKSIRLGSTYQITRHGRRLVAYLTLLIHRHVETSGGFKRQVHG
jgi:hypothetical protein